MTMLRRFLATSLLLVPLTVSATTLETSDEHFLFEQQSDRYMFGSNVSLPSPFPGDVMMLGETVTIDERVDDDVMVAGKVVIINTSVGGNVRVAGETIIIRGIVEGSVLAMGSTVTLQEGARVRGDMTALGGTVTLDGAVGGNIFVRSEQATLGEVGGNADVRGKSVMLNGDINGDAVLAGRITMADGTTVTGNMRYWSPEGATVHKDRVNGELTYDNMLATEERDSSTVAPATIGALVIGAIGIFSVISAIIMIIVGMALMPKLPGESAKFLTKHPWQSILAGSAFFFGLPVASALLAITVFGLPLAAIIFMKFLSGLLAARVCASLVLVRWLEQKYKRSWSAWSIALQTLVCYLLLKILGIIPVIGTLSSLVLVLLGFGALLAVSWQKARKIL